METARMSASQAVIVVAMLDAEKELVETTDVLRAKEQEQEVLKDKVQRLKAAVNVLSYNSVDTV